MKTKIKIVCIVGPTAVGKSDFAVQYAKKHNGEVISADSRQVYTDLDIGTGKITKKEMRSIKHYLLDVESPKKQFTVGKFKELADKAIIEIKNKGKLPIICGGTGFYIDAVVNNISYPDVPRNAVLRKKLSLKTPDELFHLLTKLDKKYAMALNNSEKNNPNRLMRSIEIATALGKIPHIKKNSSPYNIKWIKLILPKEKLIERINARLLKRLDTGMIQEVKKLHNNGLSWKRMDELGLEYRYISRFLQNKISKEEMIQSLQTEIWHYAKRQILWFKRST
jgi:tRNA dimethylallyltransferase